VHTAALPLFATVNVLAFFGVSNSSKDAVSIKQEHQDQEEEQQLIRIPEYSTIAEYDHQQ